MESRKPPLEALTSHLVAHRGLHDESTPENSLAAFEHAAELGFAIECDVHVTLEGEVVVFHDQTLTRMCQRSETVERLTRSVRTLTYLSATDQHIPTLDEVLEVVGGRVPVFVELKARNSYGALSKEGALRTARAVGEVLEGYDGPVGIMAWDARQLRWFHDHMPHVLRVQSGGVAASLMMLPLVAGILDDLRLNRISRPHAISYNAALLPRFAVNRCRREGIPVMAWTIPEQPALERALMYADNVIFESFLPVERTPSAVPPPSVGASERFLAFLAGAARGATRLRLTEGLALLAAVAFGLGLSRAAAGGAVMSYQGTLLSLAAAALLAAWHPKRWTLFALALVAWSPLALLGVDGFGLGPGQVLAATFGALLGASLRTFRPPHEA